MSRQSLALGSEFSVTTKYFVSQQSILCRNRVGQCRENFCRDRGFDVATELTKAMRNYVATKTICVATELAATENSTSHDRAGVRGLGSTRPSDRRVLSRQRILCGDRLHPVVLSRQTSYRHAVATENFRTWDFPCRDSATRTTGLAC